METEFYCSVVVSHVTQIMEVVQIDEIVPFISLYVIDLGLSTPQKYYRLDLTWLLLNIECCNPIGL